MRSAEIERLLPTMFQLAARPGSPLQALLGVMEELHAPDEEILDRIDVVVDPYRSPDEFVPWLTKWMGLEWLLSEADPRFDERVDRPAQSGPDLGRLRDIVAIGHALAQWRGTEVALLLMLNAATGLHGFDVYEPPDRPFHIIVTAPDAARSHEELVRRAVEVMKPAASTAELVFAPGASDVGEQIEPSDDTTEEDQ